MDVGFYLGELLMQQGEVSVPGLGYFVQARMSGYYNEREKKFYPPYHQAQFDVQSIDDDSLAEYIALKKNISVTSAKYFSEKYITNLKQQALIDEVKIGNLGWFYTEFSRLTFRPAHKIIDDTVFYGFEAVTINKAGDIPVEEKPKAESNFSPRSIQKSSITEEIIPEPKPAPIKKQITAPAEEAGESGISQEFFDTGEEEYEENKSPLRLLLLILAGIVILGVGIFALYQYNPDAISKLAFWQHNTSVTNTVKPKVIALPKKDTVLADTAKTKAKDTVKAAAVDTTAARYEIIAASCKDTLTANKIIKNFKTISLNAKIITDAPGRRLKISVGTYKTRKEAEYAAQVLIDARKIATDSYPLEIKPKK